MKRQLIEEWSSQPTARLRLPFCTVVSSRHRKEPAALSQTVFYTLSDLDRSALGALRQRTFPAVATEIHADGSVNLHVFVPTPPGASDPGAAECGSRRNQRQVS